MEPVNDLYDLLTDPPYTVKAIMDVPGDPLYVICHLTRPVARDAARQAAEIVFTRPYLRPFSVVTINEETGEEVERRRYDPALPRSIPNFTPR